MAEPLDWDNKGINRALDLMQNAGWIAKRDVTVMSVGMQMTPHGQRQAEAFLAIFRELECRSIGDLENVLGLISWYLNNAEMN